MRGPLDVHRELLAAQVTHEMVHLPRTVTSADELPEVLGLPAGCCVAMRFYRRDDASLLAVAVPAGQWPDLPGARPASPDEISSATDYPAATAGPFGLPRDVTLVLDSALEDGVLYCPAGDTATVIALRSQQLTAITGAVRVAFAEPVLAAPGG